MTITMAGEGASVRGHVYDYITREAVGGATVVLTLMPDSKAGPRFLPSAPKQMLTDSLGAFEFRGLASARYILSAAKGNQQQVPEDVHSNGPSRFPFPTIELAQGETTEGLALFLYPGHTITGLVRDARSSTPLEGVKVSLPSRNRNPDAQTVTDARGLFRLPGVFGSNIMLQVEKKGYLLAAGRDRSRPIEAPQVTLSMKDLEPWIEISMNKSITVSGTVKLEDGTPLSGAEITVYTPDHNWNQTKGHTDSSGAYEIEVNPFTRLRLLARAKDYPPASNPEVVEVFDEPVTGIDIVVRPGVTVSGRVVTFEGNPAAGAQVQVQSWVPLGNTSYGVNEGQTQADTEGRFSIRNIQPAPVSLRASLKGYTDSESLRVELRPGIPNDDIELVLRQSHFLAGCVTGPDDKPLSDVSIHAYSLDGISRNTQTDRDGRYRLEGLPAGSVTVNAHSQQYGSDSRQNVTVDQENVDFQLGSKAAAGKRGSEETGVQFVGYVVDWKTGQPVTDFTVSGSNSLWAIKDPNHPGRILVENYRSGWALRFLIEASGYLPLDTGFFTPTERNGKLEQTFRLGPGGSITGRVVDSDSRPLADVRVLLKGVKELYELNRQNPEQAVKTDTEGRFRLDRVHEGDNHLTVRGKPPLVDQDKVAKVRHGETTDLGDIVLTGGSRVTGRVLRIPGDLPIPGIRVTIQESETSTGNRETRTDDSGAFEFTGLKNVSYTVQVPDYSLYKSFTQSNDQQTREVVFRIGGATIRGRLLRGDAPVSNGRVMLEQSDEDSLIVSVQSDGSYEFKDVPPGTWQITGYAYSSGGGSSSPVRETVEVPAEGEVEKELILPAGRITGRVEDAEGNPVSDARVSAQPPPGRGGATDSYAPETRWTRSDSRGRFTLEGLKKGSYGLTARARGQMAMASGVNVPANGEPPPVVLRLGAGGGTIVSTALSMGTGAPVPEAWLILSNENGRYDHGRTRGPDGVLTIENVPAGRYSVQVSSYGFSINEHTIEVKEGETVHLDDVLYDAGALRWTVQKSDGTAAAGIRCRITPDDPTSIESPREGVTAADGLLIVRGLYPGTYTGTFTTPSGATVTEKIHIVAHELSNLISRMP